MVRSGQLSALVCSRWLSALWRHHQDSTSTAALAFGYCAGSRLYPAADTRAAFLPHPTVHETEERRTSAGLLLPFTSFRESVFGKEPPEVFFLGHPRLDCILRIEGVQPQFSRTEFRRKREGLGGRNREQMCDVLDPLEKRTMDAYSKHSHALLARELPTPLLAFSGRHRFAEDRPAASLPPLFGRARR